MKKKMYIFIISLILIGSGVYILLSISESNFKIYDSIESALKKENNIKISGKIELTATYNTAKRCISYSVVNRTDDTITFGDQCTVYLKSNGEWIEVEGPDGYKLILNNVYPFEKRLYETFFIEDLLEKGEYLIIKPITIEEESRYITAEFIVD